MKMKKVSITVPEEIWNTVVEEAKRQDRTKSAQVIHILRNNNKRQQNCDNEDVSQEMSIEEYREHFETKDKETRSDKTVPDPFDVIKK